MNISRTDKDFDMRFSRAAQNWSVLHSEQVSWKSLEPFFRKSRKTIILTTFSYFMDEPGFFSKIRLCHFVHHHHQAWGSMYYSMLQLKTVWTFFVSFLTVCKYKSTLLKMSCLHLLWLHKVCHEFWNRLQFFNEWDRNNNFVMFYWIPFPLGFRFG